VKRSWILLLAFGLVFVLAVPVVATPGDVEWCVGHPDHPKCDTPSEDPDPTWGNPCGGIVEGGSGFTVDLGGRKNMSGFPSNACVDVMSNAGQWTVKVDIVHGTLKSMAVNIRDSVAPGDGCFPGGSCGIGLRDIPESPFILVLGEEAIPIPEAYVNACNVFLDDNYFGEWANDTFYVNEEPSIPSPLAFMPSVSGSNDLLVTLTVTFPKYTG
jgi:hypothetical protein